MALSHAMISVAMCLSAAIAFFLQLVPGLAERPERIQATSMPSGHVHAHSVYPQVVDTSRVLSTPGGAPINIHVHVAVTHNGKHEGPPIVDGRSTGAFVNDQASFVAGVVHDPASFVADAWTAIHQKMGGADATRVAREEFVEFCKSKAAGSPKLDAYGVYLDSLFTTAVSMMPPTEETGIGKLRFGYAYLVANEFYFDKPADMLSLTHLAAVPQDSESMPQLVGVRAALNADWAAVDKDADDRVSMESFKQHFLVKHAAILGPGAGSRWCSMYGICYGIFLENDFNSALSMMLPETKNTLDGHSFRYAALMAAEFYFDGKRAADVLGLMTVGDSLRAAPDAPPAAPVLPDAPPAAPVLSDAPAAETYEGE